MQPYCSSTLAVSRDYSMGHAAGAAHNATDRAPDLLTDHRSSMHPLQTQERVLPGSAANAQLYRHLSEVIGETLRSFAAHAPPDAGLSSGTSPWTTVEFFGRPCCPLAAENGISARDL